MKKVFVTLAIIIVLIIVTLMVIPTFFKSDILRLIEEKSSKYIQAELAIEDVHVQELPELKRFTRKRGHFQARNGHSGHFNQYSSFRSIRKFTFLNFR